MKNWTFVPPRIQELHLHFLELAKAMLIHLNMQDKIANFKILLDSIGLYMDEAGDSNCSVNAVKK